MSNTVKKSKSDSGNQQAPSIIDAYLSDFVKNNPQAEIKVLNEKIEITKPWGTEDVSIICPIKDHQFIETLNKILINPRFDAIVHIDTNTIEVFASYYPKNDLFNPIIDREFKFHFNETKCECRFEEPSERFWQLADHSDSSPAMYASPAAGQLVMFKDGKNYEQLSKRAKDFFDARVPRNFFLKLDKAYHDINLEELMRHLNFVMNYYDRSGPEVIIRSEDTQIDQAKTKPIRFIESEFPKELVITSKDEIVLQLLETARRSAPRHAFVYYYQVLEYIGHYYVDDKIKKELRVLLRDPTVVRCDDRKLGEMFSLLTERNRDDAQKMSQMIGECVKAELIWSEIENDKSFFSKRHDFEGGFVLEAVISDEENFESWKHKGIKTLFDQLKSVRNCLVHAREKRENKVILPTARNNKLISCLVPIIERIACQVTINS